MPVKRQKQFANIALFTVFSFLLIIISPMSSHAEECWKIATVVQSAQGVTQNTSMGGHVQTHVWGYQPGGQYTQKNRTLFPSENDFITAWQGYIGSTTTKSDCSDIGINYTDSHSYSKRKTLYYCTKVNTNNKCTKSLLSKTAFFTSRVQ